MRVEDGLPGPGTGVEDDPVAVAVDLLLGGDPAGLAQHVGGDAGLGGREGGGVGVVDLRDDQDVRRRLRVDVPEGEGRLGLADHGRRDAPRDDLAEQAVRLRFPGHGCASREVDRSGHRNRPHPTPGSPGPTAHRPRAGPDRPARTGPDRTGPGRTDRAGPGRAGRGGAGGQAGLGRRAGGCEAGPAGPGSTRRARQGPGSTRQARQGPARPGSTRRARQGPAGSG